MDKYLAELLGTFWLVFGDIGEQKIRLFNKNPLKSQDFQIPFFCMFHMEHADHRA